MLSLVETFNTNAALQQTKDHLIRNKDYYLLGGGLAAGALGLRHLIHDSDESAADGLPKKSKILAVAEELARNPRGKKKLESI